MGHPAKIVLLRHAEKPPDDDDPHLSPRGRVRAAALSIAIADSFGKPDRIYATAPSKHSSRPVETVSPLADAMEFTVVSKWADDEVQAAAAHFLDGAHDGQLLVVCWHHGRIPALAAALGAPAPIDRWPEDVFDWYWILDFARQPLVWQSQPQSLLHGDEP